MTKDQSIKPSPLAKRVEALEGANEALQTELESAKEGQVRALADLENFRRRQAETQAGLGQHVLVTFFKKLTPNFLELSLGAMHTADVTAKSTIDKFFTDLSKHGFAKIEPATGTPIDAERHEVLMAEDGEPGTVVRVLEIGWEFEGKVVIPAKVSAAAQN